MIDLNNSTITKETIDPEFYRKYIRGRGLGAKLLYDIMKPGIDPLFEENVMILKTVDRWGKIFLKLALHYES